jgi:hypothetical protein
MKVFLFVFPTMALYCCINSTTGCRLPHIQKNISVIPGKLENVSDISFGNDNFSVSYEGSGTLVGVSRLKDDNGIYVGITVYGTANNSNVTQVTIDNGTSLFDIRIHILDCPLGLYTNRNGVCVCPPAKAFRTLPVVNCDNSTFKARVFFGYCIDQDKLLIVRCPLTIADSLTSAYIPINRSTDFCHIFNRNGTFCSSCIKNHGISVYSDTFECIQCNSTDRWKAIVSYLAIEIIPSTLFFLFILYFHIVVTCGPANGYIFFAQTMTTPFEVMFLYYIVQMFFKPLGDRYLPQGMVQSVIVPYSMWNLDFHRIFGKSAKFCLSDSLRPMDILALHYVSALYPFLLLVVCYVIIELQAMNFRPVLWMLKIICFPCVRWQRVWKAKVSILDTFATYILLTYYKVMYVTFLLLSTTKTNSFTLGGGAAERRVVSVDPSIGIYSKKHLPFLFLAVTVLLTFGLFPPLLLILYQFKTCYSFLERARLKRPGLEQFVLAFQGCYKDGTNGSPDRRFFAGLYFVFRLVMVILMTMPEDSIIVFGFKTVACISFLCVCATAQPYKQKKYTVIDCVFFSFLAIISAFQYYIYVLLQETEKFSRDILINQLLMYIPLIYMIMYVARRLFLCFKNRDSNPYLLLNDGELKDTLSDDREGNGQPVNIDISPRQSITRTEVSIAELSQENESESESEEAESSPLVGKKREMKIFSQHAATESAEYCLTRNA